MSGVGENCRQDIFGDIATEVQGQKLDEQDVVLAESSKGDAKSTATTEETLSSFVSERVQLQNLPPFFSYKQVKSLLAKKVKVAAARKIKCINGKAFFSVSSVEEANKAISALNGLEIKGKKLVAKFAGPEPLKGHSFRGIRRDGLVTAITARMSVTPLADFPYPEQLQRKVDDTKRSLSSLIKQLANANVSDSRTTADEYLEDIRPSPRVTAYRNKCEFTVGRSSDGNVCVGFVRGRFSDNQHYILPVYTCDNISEQMKRIVKHFQQFVIDSGYPPFSEFERTGVWKMFTVREFGCDVMVIATIFPMQNGTEESSLMKDFSEKFLNLANLKENRFRVTSVFWQRLANASDPVIYEHIGGAPYIYESILDTRFRVSPGAFFQTNSFAAEVLYSTIFEKCEVSLAEKADSDLKESTINTIERTEELFEDGSEQEFKKRRLDSSEKKQNVVLLDICCGTGTIGICVLNALRRVKLDSKVFLLGIELVESAVEDARSNARDNLFFDNQCHFVAAKAEDAFRNIQNYLPSNIDLNKAGVIGILDPPRAGLHDKVIFGCRTLSSMRRLIYVSCNPSMAFKNIVDLCRPSSKKFNGEPFKIECIVPVDMFPQTVHCEWVIQLCR